MSDSRYGSSYGRYGYDSPYRYLRDEEEEGRPLSMPSYRIDCWGRDERPEAFPRSRVRHTDDNDYDYRGSNRGSNRDTLSSLINLYEDDEPSSSRFSRASSGRGSSSRRSASIADPQREPSYRSASTRGSNDNPSLHTIEIGYCGSGSSRAPTPRFSRRSSLPVVVNEPSWSRASGGVTSNRSEEERPYGARPASVLMIQNSGVVAR